MFVSCITLDGPCGPPAHVGFGAFPSRPRFPFPELVEAPRARSLSLWKGPVPVP
jgi:hypothetical protein